MLNRIAIGVVVAALATSAFAQADRVSTTEKGSVLVYPKVELRWDAAGNLVQDTFISITNDFSDDVDVKMYFVALEAGTTCRWVDNDITLTENQPAYWSVATGTPGPDGDAVSPFEAITPRYPAPDGSGDQILQGFVVAFAVGQRPIDPNDGGDLVEAQIRFNHLFGEATIVNYAEGSAYQYAAYAFRALIGEDYDPVGTAGMLMFDGNDYASAFNRLLFNFYASGAQALSVGTTVATVDTELTLLPLTLDVRQDANQPAYVKAKFDIWNANEIGFSGQEYCMLCWSSVLLSAEAGHFLAGNLQTANGYARIDGQASTVCPLPRAAAPLLGVATTIISADTGDTAYAARALPGSGSEAGYLYYDVPSTPEEGIQVVPAPVEVQNTRPARVRALSNPFGATR
jgi:hypothetical protein